MDVHRGKAASEAVLTLLEQQPSALPLMAPPGLQTAPQEFRSVSLPQQLRAS